ncbi:MAG: hypothetical protein AB7S78_09785 [Candidatus Omnitrophota bacterium]
MTILLIMVCGAGGFTGGLLAGETYLYFRQARTRAINRSRKYNLKTSNQTVMA